MASAIFGGLIAAGRSPSDLIVVNRALQRAPAQHHGLQALEAAGPAGAGRRRRLGREAAALQQAAAPCAVHVGKALQPA